MLISIFSNLIMIKKTARKVYYLWVLGHFGMFMRCMSLELIEYINIFIIE